MSLRLNLSFSTTGASYPAIFVGVLLLFFFLFFARFCCFLHAFSYRSFIFMCFSVVAVVVIVFFLPQHSLVCFSCFRQACAAPCPIWTAQIHPPATSHRSDFHPHWTQRRQDRFHCTFWHSTRFSPLLPFCISLSLCFALFSTLTKDNWVFSIHICTYLPMRKEYMQKIY